MIFRYRITSRCGLDDGCYYSVKIQRYNAKFPHWRTVVIKRLRNMLAELDSDAFNGETHLWSIDYDDLLKEIKKYNSVENIIMKYITDIIIKREKIMNVNSLAKEAIDKLVVTKGWKTIEIKENEK